MKCYNHCLSMYGKECEWMAFIDADEFIVPKKTTDLRPMLAEFEKCAGLAAAWRRFGSNGHLRRPEGLQIENYTRALNDNDRMSAARFAPMVRRMLQNQEDHSWKKISRHIIVSETPARCIERVYGLLCEGAVTDALILLVKANLCFRGHPELSLLLQKSLPLIQ